jgi:hypothetical protein
VWKDSDEVVVVVSVVDRSDSAYKRATQSLTGDCWSSCCAHLASFNVCNESIFVDDCEPDFPENSPMHHLQSSKSCIDRPMALQTVRIRHIRISSSTRMDYVLTTDVMGRAKCAACGEATHVYPSVQPGKHRSNKKVDYLQMVSSPERKRENHKWKKKSIFISVDGLLYYFCFFFTQLLPSHEAWHTLHNHSIWNGKMGCTGSTATTATSEFGEEISARTLFLLLGPSSGANAVGDDYYTTNPGAVDYPLWIDTVADTGGGYCDGMATYGWSWNGCTRPMKNICWRKQLPFSIILMLVIKRKKCLFSPR